ncbi:hypothetical protein RI129_000415 [Pyrocoelia pectoralis]|uniref:Mos1 transposase HTH domain-containing protein n=1 Tax=Pyrocoelia pectoralis TaxID=417401 RepID=A0AAN7ZVS2_9COLE
MEQRNTEQWYAIKFFVKLVDSVKETYGKLVKVLGDEALSHAEVFRWHKDFKNGRESVGDEPRSGRPVETRTDNNLCAKMVPKNISAKQKHERMSISQDCLEQVEADPALLDRVITGDESWYFQYDPETKR